MKKNVVGVAKEIKSGESRVVLSPIGVKELVKSGIEVIVEDGAGSRIGHSDSAYEESGAVIVSRDDLFQKAEIIVKVKEPQASEIEKLQEGQVVFSYLHLASDKDQTDGLLKKKVTGIAFETITDNEWTLPLLTPMSEIAGKLAVQQGSYFLGKPQGGSGVLLGGISGAEKGKVLIIGGGVVGLNAIHIALGMGANVFVLDRSMKRLRYLDATFGNRITLLHSNYSNIERHIVDSDLVIGGVLIPGAAAPKLVTKKMLSTMRPGSVIVDVAIDQGGCFETSKATTHADPIFEVDGVIHYCVANMPGYVSRTSSAALEASVLPYLLTLAVKGSINAMLEDGHILNGLNVYDGKVTCKGVADSLGYQFFDPRALLLKQ